MYRGEFSPTQGCFPSANEPRSCHADRVAVFEYSGETVDRCEMMFEVGGSPINDQPQRLSTCASRSAVHEWFVRWRDAGTWDCIDQKPAEQTRSRQGNLPVPDTGVLDAQSVPNAGPAELIG